MRLGYRHPEYALFLSAHGDVRALGHSRGWVLEREIPGAGRSDAMGLDPLFHCGDWRALDDSDFFFVRERSPLKAYKGCD